MKSSESLKRNSKFSVFNIVLFTIMIITGILTLYPFLNVLALSFNEAYDSIKGGIYIIPRKFTWSNYEEMFRNKQLFTAFNISSLRTLIGTLTSIIGCSMVAYVISRKDFMFRKLFSVMLAITMYMGGGLIPDYILISKLGMFNSFLVYIIPGLIGVWNVFVIRSYIDGLPVSLQESAKIDGANDMYIYFKIILPLCIPVLVTVSLFIAVGQWNSWFDTYLYCTSNKNLTTLQYELQKMLSYANIQVNTDDLRTLEESQKQVRVTPEALKMAMTMVATAPILVVYPFIQRYFVTGLTLGAVKS